jgi:alpha-galactosidase/6-phospho-beta-glucosidase family protein
MSALFTRAYKQLQALLDQNKLSEAQQVIRELGKEALEEHGDWVMVHRERTPDVYMRG